LNDGTAMVLFTLFFDMVKGDVDNGEEIFAYFVKMAIGSPLFGGCVGMVSVYALSWANKPLNGDDVTVQITITICCAYMTFFLVESQQAVCDSFPRSSSPSLLSSGEGGH
jgi:NhaP-type Na+/H+ or K+/H+ antiporter